MPNWCNNNITITGPNSVIDKIEKIVSKKTGDDNGLLLKQLWWSVGKNPG